MPCFFSFSPEITSFSEKPGVVGDVSADTMATSDIVSAESGDDTTEKGDGKLSLRMKLVTPVEEGSSERFSLQSKSLYLPHTFMLNPRVPLLGNPLSNTFLSLRANTVRRGWICSQGRHSCQDFNQVGPSVCAH